MKYCCILHGHVCVMLRKIFVAHVNDRSADQQTMHLLSLKRSFVTWCIYGIQLIVSLAEISCLWLASAAAQGPVVQSIVSLMTSLRGHLVKYIPTTLSNTLLFFVGKM